MKQERLSLDIFFLFFLGLFILTGCSNGFALLNQAEYDRWREGEMKKEIDDIKRVKEGSDKYHAWAKQETERVEYLVGSSKQDIEEKFGKPNRIERNRKFSYKDRAFVAEEVWTYKIKDASGKDTNFDIAFAFENEIVVGVIVF